MKSGLMSFGAQLRALREAAGFTQEELATIAGLSVQAVSALERGQRRRPHMDTVRALSAALDLTGSTRDGFVASARRPVNHSAVDELSGVSLPFAPTALVGRDEELKTLRHRLADPAVRLTTLTGPGGVGKTRLALELARAIAEDGVTRVIFVPLAAIRTGSSVGPAVAESLGLLNVSALDLVKRAQSALENSPTLLVLDNFEQVLDAVPLVADLMTAIASLRLLVTSRAPLRVRGEREYAVWPLALTEDAEALSPADLARAPAVKLFLDRVRDVQSDFRLTVANGPTITAICRRLDGLPLALELAAPWLKVLTAEDLLRRLDQDVFTSTVGYRDLPERQQTLMATVAWSYQLLAPEQRRLFRHLGVLAGPFAIEAAAAVIGSREGTRDDNGEALRAAAHLLDRSLLVRVERETSARPLYQMLETVRAFAVRELAAAGEYDAAMAGLARYSVAEASLAASGVIGPDQSDWLNRIRDDLENYREAFRWLVERGRPAEAADIACGLTWFWVIRGHPIEGLHWYEQILALPPLGPARESRVLIAAGIMRYSTGAQDAARTDLLRALSLAQGSDDIDTALEASCVLGHVEHMTGHADAARQWFGKSSHGPSTPVWRKGSALTGLAWVALDTGNLGEAERFLDAARSALEHAGPWFLLLVDFLHARLAILRGNLDQAIASVRESVTRIRILRDQFAFLYALIPLASVAVLKSNDAWVARILGARDAVAMRTGAAVVDNYLQHLLERFEGDARARLGSENWTRIYEAGRTTSIDSLLIAIDNDAAMLNS